MLSGIHPEQLLSHSIGLLASLKSISHLQFCDLLMSLRSKHILGDSPRAGTFTFYSAAGFLEEHLSLSIL